MSLFATPQAGVDLKRKVCARPGFIETPGERWRARKVADLEVRSALRLLAKAHGTNPVPWLPPDLSGC